MKKVSIIVPVYNVDKYIRNTLESILKQDYQNKEIIIIDDGSTDKSLEICNNILYERKNVKIIHQNNLGVSVARNKGLENATGDYIMFVDADDILERDMISTLVKIMDGKNADIAMAGLTISEDRKEKVDFSIEYCTAAQRLAVAIDDTTFDGCKSKEDVDNILKTLSGVKAGGATAQTGLYYLQGSEDFDFEGFPNLEVLQYKKVSDAVQALAVGNIQIVCADKDVLELAVNGVNR